MFTTITAWSFKLKQAITNSHLLFSVEIEMKA